MSEKLIMFFAQLASLGSDVSEELFVERFKEEWPDDWKKIVEKFELEEADTPPRKKHPMPEPEVYMKEMYRNCCRRWREEKNGD